MVKYAIIGLVLAAIAAYTWHLYQIDEQVKIAQGDVVEEYVNKAMEQVIETLQLERDVAKESLKIERKVNDEKQTIIVKRDALIVSLQQRPKRESAKSSVSEGGVSCSSSTGAQLSREDGEFLTGEAARAEQLMAERDYYYGQYMVLFNQINKGEGK